jgi:hypothetical protein
VTTSFPGATAIARVDATRAAQSLVHTVPPTVDTYFDSKALSTELEVDLTTSREADNKSSREYHRNIRRGVTNSLREAKVIF